VDNLVQSQLKLALYKPEYDVVVVGAGPAGLCAARSAATGNAKVLILEKEREIGYPVKTSGGTWIDDVARFGIPQGYYNPISRCVFSSPRNSALFTYKDPKVCILDVRRTYQHLAFECGKAGCQIALGASAQGLLRKNGIVAGVAYSQHGDTRKVEAKVVIDATGISAILAREAKMVERWERIGAGAEFEAYVENLPSDTIHLIVGKGLSPSGYSWIFPVSKSRARIGVGLIRPETSDSPINYLLKLVEKLPSLLGETTRIVPIEFHQWSVPCAGPLDEVVRDGLIVVGDAAGHASPLLGEGIRHAMKFGELAGSAAADAIKQNDCSYSNLAKFQHDVNKETSTNYTIALEIQRRMAGFSDDKWDEVVDKLKQLSSEEFARFIHGDFSISSIVSLMAKHPFLVTSTTAKMVLGILKGK